MLTSPGFILLFIILAMAWLFGTPANRAVRKAQMNLTADEARTFAEKYRRASSRADMPSRFAELAQAKARAERVWLISSAAILIVLVWIILAGPGLGLVPYPRGT